MNEKIKIAMLGHKRIPSREGGIEIVVEELATRMVKFFKYLFCNTLLRPIYAIRNKDGLSIICTMKIFLYSFT